MFVYSYKPQPWNEKKGVEKREKKRGKKFGCKSHRLQAAESLFACSGLVQAAPLCTWIYYAIHVRVYINCYVETCTCALFVCAYTHTRARVRAPWLSRGEHLRRAFLRRHRERTSKNSTLHDSRWIHAGLLVTSDFLIFLTESLFRLVYGRGLVKEQANDSRILEIGVYSM